MVLDMKDSVPLKDEAMKMLLSLTMMEVSEEGGPKAISPEEIEAEFAADMPFPSGLLARGFQS